MSHNLMINYKWCIAGTVSLALASACLTAAQAADSSPRSGAKVRARTFNPFDVTSTRLRLSPFGVFQVQRPQTAADVFGNPGDTTTEAAKSASAPAVVAATSTIANNNVITNAITGGSLTSAVGGGGGGDTGGGSGGVRPPFQPPVRSPYLPPPAPPFPP